MTAPPHYGYGFIMKCSEPNCTREVTKRGLCNACYIRKRRAGELQVLSVKLGQKCSIEGCDRIIDKYGGFSLCSKHYQRYKKYGDPKASYLKNLVGNDLEEKIRHSKESIKGWYEAWEGQVYVSFSGGKDSLVLLDLVRSMYPDVPALFINTGLEFPEIKEFVRTIDNVEWVRPKMSFSKVIEVYGYPVISKENAHKISDIRNTKSESLRNSRLYGDAKGNGKLPDKFRYLIEAPFKISSECCHALKRNPARRYEKKTGRVPFVGTTVFDSRLRASNYFRYGCAHYDTKHPVSIPISLWTRQDMWDYIHANNLGYSEVYNLGYKNTGCIFCAFGMHLDSSKKNKFQLLKSTHPKYWEYCINKLEMGKVLDYIGVKYK